MENAIKIAARSSPGCPRIWPPETTDGRQGFIHPTDISGSMDAAHLKFIIRDFVNDGLTEKEDLLNQIAEDVMLAYPGSTMRFKVTEQYRNMKEVLDRHPEIVGNLEEAVRRVGLEPVTSSIRGGTDGSRLSFMGLPCPNIYTGGHSYHSPLEWISRQDMEKVGRHDRRTGQGLGGTGIAGIQRGSLHNVCFFKPFKSSVMTEQIKATLPNKARGANYPTNRMTRSVANSGLVHLAL
jgi:hypothetical protein